MCNGQFMPINQNQALFSLLGTMYGGNGQTTFALPDLRGRVPLHRGSSLTQGQALGEEAHTINSSEMAAHNHGAAGLLAERQPGGPEDPRRGLQRLHGALPTSPRSRRPRSRTSAASQAHENRQPYLVLNWCIALQGVFPSRN